MTIHDSHNEKGPQLTTPAFRPKYISFDIYGTLIHYQMREAVAPILSDRLDDAQFEAFMNRFRIYRFDEILDYRPYDEVLECSYRRTCEYFGLAVGPDDAATISGAVLSWGAHDDVIVPLKRMAEHFPLVALSNADDRHLAASMPRLEAPFHAVLTAEQAGAYKPRYRAFEYMFDTLNAKPDDFLHISSHQRYDHIPLFDLGTNDKVFLDRGYDPDLPYYGAVRMTSLDEVNTALGI